MKHYPTPRRVQGGRSRCTAQGLERRSSRSPVISEQAPRPGGTGSGPPTSAAPAPTPRRRQLLPPVPTTFRRPAGVFAPFKAYPTARFTDTGGSITAPQVLAEIRAQG